MSLLRPDFWRDRTVLVTGHMGFKGAWLTYLLSRLGARTVGYGIDVRDPLLYRELAIPGHSSIEADVNDLEALGGALEQWHPSVVLHLAAQPIVIASYDDPIGTFRNNIMGTASLLQACRGAGGLEALVVVTSDKVYRNNEWNWAYRETEPLGGHDPYSASKAAAEIVTHSMIASFYAAPAAPAVATARAGNVIGGGDWAAFRLLPDGARAFRTGGRLELRNPDSVRPWQHVLEPLVGYLQLAQALAARRHDIPARAWNFGPASDDTVSVGEVAHMFAQEWGGSAAIAVRPPAGPQLKEVGLLAVDSSMARAHLAWRPRWDVGEAVRRTAHWYRDHAAGAPARRLMDRDIDGYLELVAAGEGQQV
jgi:CDP-glucose 4,6-dehydratase